MTNPEFLDELRAMWARNCTATILFARLNHQRIPPEIVGVAQNMNRAFREQQDINESVTLALESMGISGKGGGMGAVMDPEAFMFAAAMAQIVACRGNPPGAAALRANAVRIATGKIDPITAFELATPPGMSGLLRMVMPMLVEDDPVFGEDPLVRSLGLFMAAMAVPWEEIPQLLGLPAGHTPEQAFASAMRSTLEAIKSRDIDTAQEHLVVALEAAAQTPGAEDDLQAVRRMTLLAAIGEVKPENIKLVVQRLVALKGDPGLTDKLADVTRALMALIQDYGLTRELGADLVRFARSMLKKVSATQRLKLTLGTASTLLQLGETAEAETLVAGVKGKYAGADERLWIARVEADIHWFDEDRDGAADILVDGLEQGASAEPSQRMMALQKLVGLWPEGREGIDPWLQEFETATKNLEEPHREVAKVTTALAALRSGRPRDAEALVKSVDLARLEREAPESLRRMVRDLRGGLKALGSTKRAKR